MVTRLRWAAEKSFTELGLVLVFDFIRLKPVSVSAKN
jgi:hypothetical protein